MFRNARVVLPLIVFTSILGQQLLSLAGEPTIAGDSGSATQKFDKGSTERPEPRVATDEALATVNGVPIRQADVDFALRKGHGNESADTHRRNILERIIQQELARQRAIELGLDTNPEFQASLRRIEAQLNDFKRKELSKLFIRHEMKEGGKVSETAARRYFVENEATIITEYHVWQILARKEEQVEDALNEIKLGESFDEVARRQFPDLPKTAGKPWDLGFLKWTQIPKPWQASVYDLKQGEVSEVIRGPNHRFWIIKLIEKRKNPRITFDSVKPIIVAHLKNLRIKGLHESTNQELRANSNIVYAKGMTVGDESASVRSARLLSRTPTK